MNKKFYSVLLVLSLFLVSPKFLYAEDTAAKDTGASVAPGKKVKMDYTLTVDGQVMDTSEGKKPLEFVQGESPMIPGLVKQLEGMKAGEQKSIVVSALEGYGPVDPKAIIETPTNSLPAGLKPQVGTVLEVQMAEGQSFPATISEIKGDKVVLNFNHPLAGKELHFDVKIVSVE